MKEREALPWIFLVEALFYSPADGQGDWEVEKAFLSQDIAQEYVTIAKPNLKRRITKYRIEDGNLYYPFEPRP